MNRRISVLMALLVIVVVGGALAIGLSGNKKAADGCSTNTHVVTHDVIIRNSNVSQPQVVGKLCDTLTITNKDAEAREIAFGAHERHVPYDGVAERVLAKGQSLTITFNKAGTYHWHDHLHDEVEGYFTVSQ